MRVPILTALLLLCFSIPATAQQHNPEPVFLRFTHDNDCISPTPKKDRYYTAGTQLAVDWRQTSNTWINTLLPSPFTGGASWYRAALMQHIQTPQNLKDRELQPKDYPYAATLYGSLQRKNYSAAGDQEVTSSFWLGMMGPAALGEETQKALHRMLHFKEPLGWQHQIVNNIVINYNTAYALNVLKKGPSRLNVQAGLEAGSLFSNFQLGAEWLVTHTPARFTGQLSDALRPGRPHFYLSLHPQATYVLVNELLEGAVRNPYAVDGSKLTPLPPGNLERLLYGADLKLGILGNRFGVELSEAWRSRELRTTAPYIYGSLSVQVRLR
jgi:hypothetical protein